MCISKILKLPTVLWRIFKKFLLPNVVLAAFVLLFLYLDRFDLFEYLIVCPLHFFGLYCPTCGMTRAAHALLSLDIAASLRYHPLLPLFILMVLYYELVYLCSVLKGSQPLRRPRRMLFLTIAAFLIFFILRNVLLLGFGIDLVGDFIK